ncbi:lysophospholipid acyltransferase family protein [Roseibacillus ishigakijimensis]|uniref:Lysophospholipid acyltransferase family protein n=1 Tax=Roseibacillus ishigakijimensis TaxID=454146 RepID=A0A934RRL0_9BACT|nr:lysophospholipid acyltransferase family protein [Roseibacillus ishigakijimensis]MBK1834178.1 lysophospholipid acyltransferase family protein [Roseibacillus ishigakijimensis]
MAKKHDIRSSWQALALGKAAGALAVALARTLALTVRYRCQGPLTPTPRIFALYHNRMIGAAAAAGHWREHRPGVVLTSASKDGASLAAAMECFGLGAVRGSSSRRGAAALVALRKAISAGNHVCITPDGPRGPLYEIQPGLVKLSSLTGAPIIPFLVNYERYWELGSWDRFQIPHPYSRAEVVFGEEIVVPPSLSEDDLEFYRKKVEEVMRESLNAGRDDDN